ncbi:uncharacterized protein C8Q71DRAFT_737579 [Rhodofomes roseus]|uniref:Uncharacterized protein n=1 Tax=Rhodofomes roseus TaxID=34475 RepID=A0ABQ8KS61_9APHY|nr:uncharacterized protein C8Q71DRAFT_737579 [Rhodofomes roseus]KAH9841547.1 hypothetical protein C8Q71DRAFT_737579 [Rhodofomes roseus]
MLRESPGLESLSLNQIGPVSIESQTSWRGGNDTILCLPSLRRLTIETNDPPVNFFECFAFPNLTRLTLCIVYQESPTHGEEVVQDLLRPSPATGRSVLSGLQSLRIAGVCCNDRATVAGVYATLTNLQTLSLDFETRGMVLSRGWYDVLTTQWESIANANEEPLLPQLQALKLIGLSGKDMRHLIEVRAATRRPVRQVYVYEENDLAQEDKSWIKHNVDTFEYFDSIMMWAEDHFTFVN